MDPSVVAPMLATAATGMLGSYAQGKLSKLNPVDKIESAVHSKLDSTRAGRWINSKIDKVSDFMDRKLGTGSGSEVTPEMRSAISSEVTTQLNSRGLGRGSSSPPLPSNPPSTTTPNQSPRSTSPPPRPSGTSGGRR